MKSFLLLLVAVSSVVGTSPDGRIVGGQTALDGQFPYQAILKNYGKFFCGGSILNTKYILTAGHCLPGVQANGVTVHLGTNILDQLGDVYHAIQLISHALYNQNTMHNDIALIQVFEPIVFTQKVQPIPLETAYVQDGQDVILSGFGLTSYPGNIPPYLQYIYLKTLNTYECSRRLYDTGLQIDDSQICTFTTYGEGACQGDSGGPLVYNGKLAGVVSFGKPCAIGSPDVFTRVSRYTDWIYANMR